MFKELQLIATYTEDLKGNTPWRIVGRAPGFYYSQQNMLIDEYKTLIQTRQEDVNSVTL